jgi:hypothetical protein
MIGTFTPYFFKKLDAYQEIIRQEKRGRRTWPIEKTLLTWCGSEHEHLGSVWKYAAIKKKIQKENLDLNELIPAICNLEAKGLADTAGSREDIYRFTESGILLGEVLFSINNPLKKFWYWLNLWLFKILILVLALTALFALLNQALELWQKTFK